VCIYYHALEDRSDDELSLGYDDGIPLPSDPAAHLNAAPATPPEVTPKQLQIEADLWQARLGHCSDWQLKVIPLSADGLPPKFQPHPFAFYDHYQQARVRKRPATKGKHPSRALTKSQRWYMDFGFMRSSQFDYSRPDKKDDRVVTSFDGYNSYLLVVDEYTKMTWVYLCVSKEPPLELIGLHLDQFGAETGYIRTDQGGELAHSENFVSQMALRKYFVEPTGADSPDQNKQAEKYNDTFAVTVRVLLYGSGLPAIFWSAALLHACYLHNRRVHKSIMMTPFEAWHGIKPDLRTLRVFGSRVCVKRTGKRRSKLDRHDFSGIFIGYTATNENIRYIDVITRLIKTSHHAVFDEAWYLQPSRPPFAQMLYEVGLEPNHEPITPSSVYVPDPPLPVLSLPKPPKLPKFATLIPLPLRASSPPQTYAATAAHTHTVAQLAIPATVPLQVAPQPKRRLEHDMCLQHDISQKDFEMVYLSHSSFNNSFEEILDIQRYDPTISSTGGLQCEEKASKVFLRSMQPSTPAAKIRAWRSRLRGAWIIKVDDTMISSISDIEQALLRAKNDGHRSCTILMAHDAIRDGLVETGIPQINVDQLNGRHTMLNIEVMTQAQYDRWFASLPRCFFELIEDGGVLNFTTECHKLTRRILLQQDDWDEWNKSEHIQLDAYEKQFMFGKPVKATKKLAIFNLIWTYSVKTDDGRKKARCTCDGSTRSGQVRVFDHVHANSLDQTGSRVFYATSAVENLLIFGSDVSNAFGEAPPPTQGFYIRPDQAFKDWWVAKGNDPIPDGYVIPVLAAMQGHPESPRKWEKHVDKILRTILSFTPTVHEPCLYKGCIDGARVLFKRQVDDFALATATKSTADKVFDLLDAQLRIPMRRMGLIAMYNGLDVLQSRYFIKIYVKTWLAMTLQPYFETWLDIPDTKFPVPLGTSESFLKRLYSAKGDPSTAAQLALEKSMGFKYRKGVGQLIWPMSTCRPDVSQPVIKVAQGSACPAEAHYLGVRSIFRYLAATMDDGIYFWRTEAVMSLPEDPMPPIASTPHDIRLAHRPHEQPSILNGFMDSAWADCLLTRRSTGGVNMRLAGGPVAWKASLWPTVAGSSTEAEFTRSYVGGVMSLYLRSILWDLDVPQMAATHLYEDNDGATAMANAGKPTPRSRHIDVKYYAIQEWVERDLVILQRIDTADNTADILTKPLSRILFYRHKDYLMGFVPPQYSPKYPEVARKYLLDDTGSSSNPNTYVAKAATTVAPWQRVIHSMYLMPLASFRSASNTSPERGGVTDTYDSGLLRPGLTYDSS
jgi:hypothetical protein